MKYCPICDTQYEDTVNVCTKDGAQLLTMKGQEDPLIGTILKDRYRIIKKIGEGGMGAIYLAEQQPLGRQVAIKMIHAGGQDNPALVKRFLREAKALSALLHPNIVSILDFGNTAEGATFLVMEYLEGHQLEYYTGEHRLTKEELDSVISQIAAGLAAAHAHGLIHRDIKPANILITESGGQKIVKILDFGIVKSDGKEETNLTQSGGVVGTPGYISPEQLKGGREPDSRCDIYALGAVIYFLIKGARPYEGSTQSIIFKQLTEPPGPMNFEDYGYSKEMRQIVLKAMAMNPKDRFKTTTELAQAVHLAILGRKRIDWRRFVIANVIALLVALFIARTIQIYIGHQYRQAEHENNNIYFGLSSAFSGHNRDMGRAVKNGIEVAIARYNAMGGFHGRKVALLLKNDAYQPEKALLNTKEFVEDPKVMAIIGNGGDASVKAVLPVISAAKIPFIGPICGADFMAPSPPLPYVFNLAAGYKAQVESSYGYYLQKMGLKSSEIAIFAQNDTYGQESVLSAQNYLKKHGFDHELTVLWHEVGSAENMEQVAKLKTMPNIKAIISASIAKPIAFFIADMRKSGLDYPLITLGLVSTIEIARELSVLGLESVNNVFVSTTLPPIDADLPMLRRFYEDFAEFAPTEPTTELALHGYLAMQLTFRAMATLKENFTRGDLRLALESLHKNNLGFGGYCQMSASDHICLERVWFLQFDGEGNWRVVPY